MQFEEENPHPLINTQNVVVGAMLLGIFVFSVGIGLVLFRNQKSGDIQILTPSNSPQVKASVDQILVDVDGEVKNPGVYKLAKDARVQDAVDASGGLLLSADRAQVNLAAKIVDGQKIHIAGVGEVAAAKTGFGKLVNAQVSINSASEQELDTLPSVGPATVQKIIAGRPYSTLEELVSKKAVSKSTFDKIHDLISL